MRRGRRAACRVALCALVELTGVVAGHPARAQDEAAAAARAQALFDEGQRLMADQRYEAACDRFAESDRVQASGSALANLADCLEKRGLLASAWRRFKQAQDRAIHGGKADIAKFLVDRIAKLEPRLARVAIQPSPADAPHLVVTIDEVEIGQDEWAGAPVDAGSHAVVASAAGKLPFRGSLDVRDDAARLTLKIPPLADPPPAPVASGPPAEPAASRPPGPAPPSGWSTQRTLALVAGGVGVAAVATGSVFGVIAKSKNDDAVNAGCAGSTCPTQGGVDLSRSAVTAGDAATVLFLAGGAAVAAAAVLWLTAPTGAASAGSATIAVAPVLGARSGGLGVNGAW